MADGSTTDADVLNATLVGTTAFASISNVETINLDARAADTFAMATVTGAKAVNVNTNAGNAVALTGITVASAPVIGISGSGVVTATVNTLAGTTALGTAETLSLDLTGSTGAAGFTLNATTTGVLETLNIDSNGAAKNNLTLTAGAGNSIAKAVITGDAALELRGTAAVYNGVELNGGEHKGDLTVNADFDGGGTTIGLNAEKFTGVDQYIVRDTAAAPGNTSFGLFNVADASNVRIADNIAGTASIISVLGASSGSDNSLSLTLQNDATVAEDVDVAGLTVSGVEAINITSAGAPTTGAAADQENSISLSADKLVTLTIDGASNTSVGLAAGTITTANTANITIDGSAATGKLSISAGDIANLASGTRTVTLEGGANDDVLAGSSTAAVKNVYDLSEGGKDKVVLSAAGVQNTNDVVTDFSNGDVLAMTAAAANQGTFVNGLNSTIIDAAEQAVIETQATLTAAAVEAAKATGVADTTEHAVAFSYQGNQYMLMSESDVAGNDAFANGDAIVQISGLSSSTTFDAGTFLFA